jgi:hypothetical protein
MLAVDTTTRLRRAFRTIDQSVKSVTEITALPTGQWNAMAIGAVDRLTADAVNQVTSAQLAYLADIWGR